MIFTFCISAQAQFDGIIVVNEWETENQAKTEKLMNDWKNIISKMENAPRAFFAYRNGWEQHLLLLLI
jgi:hypothetical protein